MSQRFCTQCGAPLPAEGNFCPQCGAPIDRRDETAGLEVAPLTPRSDAQPVAQAAMNSTPVQTPPQRDDRQSGGSRPLLIGLGAAAVIAALLAVVYFAFLRPAGLESDCGEEPCRVDLAAVADAPADEDIPYPDVARISPQEAKALFDADAALFVDVRDRDSYTTMHIPGAVWIPLTDVSARADELPKGAQIVTYCS